MKGSWLFGKREAPAPPAPPPPAPPTLAEQIKLNRRQIDRACRELDRERTKMENQERRVKAEIRRVAHSQQVDAARILAKDLARTRAHVSKMYQMRTQMQSVSMQMSAMRTQEAMASTMGSVVQMMTRMNRGMNLPAMQNMIMQFEMEQGKMEMTSEMMDDALDEMTGVEESEEAERILQEVMAEAGMSDIEKLGGTSVPVGAHAPPQQEAGSVNLSEIDQRLEELRR